MLHRTPNWLVKLPAHCFGLALFKVQSSHMPRWQMAKPLNVSARRALLFAACLAAGALVLLLWTFSTSRVPVNQASDDPKNTSDAFNTITEALRLPTDLNSSNTSAQTGSSVANRPPFTIKTSRTDLLIAIPSSLARSVCHSICFSCTHTLCWYKLHNYLNMLCIASL